MRKSQAFASHRHAVILELNNKLINEIVPAFNAEAEDIRRQHETDCKNLGVGEALADHKRRARIADMLVRRKEFVDGLQTHLKMEMHGRINEYEGKVKEEDGKDGKKILVVDFPDGSVARCPKSLWVDYKLFQHV